jgi:hypothetical protein
MSAFVTIEMLREHLGDSTRDLEAKRDGDLAWSDQELKSAMEAVARSYNSLPPFVETVRWTNLSADTEIFLDGAAAAVMERRVRNLTTERTQFQAGGITTDPDGAIIDGLTKLAERLRGKFEREATARKANRNWLHAFGRVG